MCTLTCLRSTHTNIPVAVTLVLCGIWLRSWRGPGGYQGRPLLWKLRLQVSSCRSGEGPLWRIWSRGPELECWQCIPDGELLRRFRVQQSCVQLHLCNDCLPWILIGRDRQWPGPCGHTIGPKEWNCFLADKRPRQKNIGWPLQRWAKG